MRALHGDDFGGRVMADEPVFHLVAPNLTRGKGSAVLEYTPSLVEGASEKDIAHEFGASLHTAHDHVKALHARSRGELLAQVVRAAPPRTRLLAELA